MRPTERRRRELERQAQQQAQAEQVKSWDATMRTAAELVPADFRPQVRRALAAVAVNDEQGVLATLAEVLPPEEFTNLLRTVTERTEARREADPPPAPEYPPLLTGQEAAARFGSPLAGDDLDQLPMPDLPEGTSPKSARRFRQGWLLGVWIVRRWRSARLNLAMVFATWAERLAQG